MNLSKLPTVAYVCVTVVILGVLGSMTYLSAIGADATEIRQVFNTVANLGGLVLGSIGAVAGSIAARRATDAAEQTNGGLVEAVREAVERDGPRS